MASDVSPQAWLKVNIQEATAALQAIQRRPWQLSAMSPTDLERIKNAVEELRNAAWAFQMSKG